MFDRYPLKYQITLVILSALFVWAFVIAREPRQWRRLYQSIFSKGGQFSVNKNKVIDETLKGWGIVIAMIFLVLDVWCFVHMLRQPDIDRARQMSVEDWNRLQEQNKIQSTSPVQGRAGIN